MSDQTTNSINTTPNELALYSQVQLLTAQIATLTAQMQNSHPVNSTLSTLPTSPPLRVKINNPMEFKGSRDVSRPFLSQCELVFNTRPDLYPNGLLAQVNYAASYLRDSAFLWFQTFKVSSARSGIILNYTLFKTAFLEAFGETDLKSSVYSRVEPVGSKGLGCPYATNFNRHAANTGINDETLQYLFMQGLKDEITELLLIYDSFSSILDLQAKSIKIDNRRFNLQQRRKIIPKAQQTSKIQHSSARFSHPAATNSSSTNHSFDSSSPMQIDTTVVGRSPLSKEEKIRCKNASLCGYCGESTCGGFPDLSKCTKLAGRPGFQPRRTA